MHPRLLSRISRFSPLLATFLLACGPVAAADGAPQPISAAQFREDIAFVRAMIARMHPDPGFSTDPPALHRALDRMAHEAPLTLTRDEAWRRLAAVNALLADGHFLIGYPDWRKETRAWLAQGGGLFPVEVNVDPDGALHLSTAPARVVSVNGVAAGELVSTLSSMVHGDTPRFRANPSGPALVAVLLEAVWRSRDLRTGAGRGGCAAYGHHVRTTHAPARPGTGGTPAL